MTTSLAQAVESIRDALDARDLPTARAAFDRAAQGCPKTTSALVKQLGADVAIPKGAIIVDFGIDVWNNPYRDDYAWRCGDCPWTGSNYTTAPAARTAAEAHAAEHRDQGDAAPRVGSFNEIHDEVGSPAA